MTRTARPASEAQIRFIRDLLAQRDPAVTGVTDVEALVALVRQADTRKASAVIDTLKGLPVKGAAPAAPGQAATAAPANVRANRYGAKCVKCGVYVPEGAGALARGAGGKWETSHVGDCPAGAPTVAPTGDLSEGVYLADTGTIYKVYTTQNDRLGAKVLTITEGAGPWDDRLGRNRDAGSFEYVPGLLARVRDMVTMRTARLLTQEEAAAFGKLHGFCSCCGRDLDDDRSLAVGYGPVCAGHRGWFYPTVREAAEMLARPTTTGGEG